MVIIGVLVGWRGHTSIFQAAFALALMLAFSNALAWIFAIVGMISPNAEAAQAASFPILAPLVFASTAFVSADTMPGPLKWFAEHQPVSIVIDAVRSLTYGGPFHDPEKVLAAIIWTAAIIAIAAPVAVRIYRRKV